MANTDVAAACSHTQTDSSPSMLAEVKTPPRPAAAGAKRKRAEPAEWAQAISDSDESSGDTGLLTTAISAAETALATALAGCAQAQAALEQLNARARLRRLRRRASDAPRGRPGEGPGEVKVAAAADENLASPPAALGETGGGTRSPAADGRSPDGSPSAPRFSYPTPSPSSSGKASPEVSSEAEKEVGHAAAPSDLDAATLQAQSASAATRFGEHASETAAEPAAGPAGSADAGHSNSAFEAAVGMDMEAPGRGEHKPAELAEPPASTAERCTAPAVTNSAAADEDADVVMIEAAELGDSAPASPAARAAPATTCVGLSELAAERAPGSQEQHAASESVPEADMAPAGWRDLAAADGVVGAEAAQASMPAASRSERTTEAALVAADEAAHAPALAMDGAPPADHIASLAAADAPEEAVVLVPAADTAQATAPGDAAMPPLEARAAPTTTCVGVAELSADRAPGCQERRAAAVSAPKAGTAQAGGHDLAADAVVGAEADMAPAGGHGLAADAVVGADAARASLTAASSSEHTAETAVEAADEAVAEAAPAAASTQGGRLAGSSAGRLDADMAPAPAVGALLAAEPAGAADEAPANKEGVRGDAPEGPAAAPQAEAEAVAAGGDEPSTSKDAGPTAAPGADASLPRAAPALAEAAGLCDGSSAPGARPAVADGAASEAPVAEAAPIEGKAEAWNVADPAPQLLRRAAKRIIVAAASELGIAGEYKLTECAAAHGRPSYKAAGSLVDEARCPHLVWTPRGGGHWVFIPGPAVAESETPDADAPLPTLARSLQVAWTALPDEVMFTSWTQAAWGRRGQRVRVAMTRG